MFKVSFVSALFFAGVITAQTAVQQFNAEVPDAFGSVSGRVVLAGDQFVFLSDSKPEASFTTARRDIQAISGEADVVSIQLRNPIRGASGDRSRVSVRIPDPAAKTALDTWFNLAGPASAAESASNKQSPESRSFEARHKKTFGGSKGRLLITPDGLAYESIDDVKDSRRWEFRDIKEVKLKSPYDLEVKPFSGDDYDFALDGQGMGTAEYRDLVDRITKARVEPRN